MEQGKTMPTAAQIAQVLTDAYVKAGSEVTEAHRKHLDGAFKVRVCKRLAVS